jgi:hypothetical protein
MLPKTSMGGQPIAPLMSPIPLEGPRVRLLVLLRRRCVTQSKISRILLSQLRSDLDGYSAECTGPSEVRCYRHLRDRGRPSATRSNDILGAAIVGAIFGDGLSFWLGRRYHREILLRWPLNRYPQFIDRSEAFIKTYGGASVFLARFIAVVRAFVPLVAGILGMSSRQFYAANILSALVWAPAHVFPGVLLGMALNLAGLSPGRLAILLIVGLIAVSAAVRALRSYLNRHPFPPSLPDIAT